MNRNEHLLLPLRQSIREWNPRAIEFYLGLLNKKLSDSAISPRFRVEIYLEVVKALRVLGRAQEAIQFAEIAISNIPADALDILAALKRLRALLALDSQEFQRARNLIDEADGLELVLDGNNTIVSRKDQEVKVETWLVTTEIALAQNDLAAAEKYFDNAATRLSMDEAVLHTSRLNPMEKTGLEQYQRDMRKMLVLYDLVLAIKQNVPEIFERVEEIFNNVQHEHDAAQANGKTPNIAVFSRLSCLLQRWNDDDHTAPAGLTLAEARRWTAFGRNENLSEKLLFDESDGHEPDFKEERSNTALDSNHVVIPMVDKIPDPMYMALYKMTEILGKIENVLPTASHAAKSEPDFTQRGFQGHLMDTDIFTFFQNFQNLRFNGLLKLNWHKDLYRVPVTKGVLPEIICSGGVTLYIQNGILIDVIFVGQVENHSPAKAQENLVLVLRLALSLGVDIRPDIIGIAIPDENVAERSPILNVTINELLFVMSNIERELAGIEADDQESGDFDLFARQADEMSGFENSDPVHNKENASLNLPEKSKLNTEFKSVPEKNSDLLNLEDEDNKKPVVYIQPASDDNGDILDLI